jgi:hypothetical protein
MENPVWNSRAPIAQDEQQSSSSIRRADNEHWPKKITRDNCDTVFSFLTEYSVLVCKQHCTGIINLDRHLREQHGTPITLRRQVVHYFSQFSTVDSSAIELPEQPALPIQELGAPLDGIKCKSCSFITVNTGNMKTHCKKSHQLSWTSDKAHYMNLSKFRRFSMVGGCRNILLLIWVYRSMSKTQIKITSLNNNSTHG